jgi:DUF1680 family protein
MWNWRMLQINGDARYSDLVEWTYYNAVLPAISLDGNAYYYTNPLKNDEAHKRQKWFDCACCPPNISRIIAEFPGYIYSVSDEGIWLHLYASSKANILLRSERQVEVEQSTRYPWDGHIILRIGIMIPIVNPMEEKAGEEFSLFLRVPGWLEDQQAVIKINDEIFNQQAGSGSYLEIHRNWQTGDNVTVDFPMKVRYLESHPLVAENTGRIAITRGPLVYCMESADNSGIQLSEVRINPLQQPEVEFVPDLLGGIVQLRFLAEIRIVDTKWHVNLYRPLELYGSPPKGDEVEVTSIPYYAWANRAPGEMEIWHLYSK